MNKLNEAIIITAAVIYFLCQVRIFIDSLKNHWIEAKSIYASYTFSTRVINFICDVKYTCKAFSLFVRKKKYEHFFNVLIHTGLLNWKILAR